MVACFDAKATRHSSRVVWSCISSSIIETCEMYLLGKKFREGAGSEHSVTVPPIMLSLAHENLVAYHIILIMFNMVER